MARNRRSVVSTDQKTLDECFLSKFKSPTPKKMTPKGIKADGHVMKLDLDDDGDDENQNNMDVKPSVKSELIKEEDSGLKLPLAPRRSKRNISGTPPPASPFKRSRFTAPKVEQDNKTSLQQSPVKQSPRKVSSRYSQPPSSPWKDSPVKKTPRKDKDSDGDDSDDSSDSDEELSADAIRRKNIKDNMKFLAQLGIEGAKKDLKESAKKSRASSEVKGLRRETVKQEVLPRRASLRIRKIESDGIALAQDHSETERNCDIRVVDKRGRSVPGISKGNSDVDKSDRKPLVPLDMAEILYNGPPDLEDYTDRGSFDPQSETKENPETPEVKKERRLAEKREFFASLTNFMKTAECPKDEDFKIKSEDQFVKDLKKLRCGEALERKVTKDRVFGIGLHPSISKTLVAVGDKWGGVGIWDVDDDNTGDDGVHLFYPHSRPINVLQFPEWNTRQLFSCSYDGTIRMGDFEKGVFDLVFAHPEEKDIAISSFAFVTPTELVASDLSGGISTIDVRCDRKDFSDGITTYKAHPKSCRNVDVHPVNSNYCVSTGTEGSAHIWDLRKMSQNRPKPVLTINQARVINSAYFSPVTGNKILTTGMDDSIRVYDFSDKKSDEAVILNDLRHNNNTGRWLTKFRANWYPKREDLILSGLMGHPRQIELYSCTSIPKKLEKIHEFKDDEVLGSICCVIHGHPYKPMVVGGNASGKVYVFR